MGSMYLIDEVKPVITGVCDRKRGANAAGSDVRAGVIRHTDLIKGCGGVGSAMAL